MVFNPDKCEVMHLWKSYGRRAYAVNHRVLSHVDGQGDLGVEAYSSLKVASQEGSMVKKV